MRGREEFLRRIEVLVDDGGQSFLGILDVVLVAYLNEFVSYSFHGRHNDDRLNLVSDIAAAQLEGTPRGEQVWISVRDADRVDVYDTMTFEKLSAIEAEKPSGIFLTARANKIGL